MRTDLNEIIKIIYVVVIEDSLNCRNYLSIIDNAQLLSEHDICKKVIETLRFGNDEDVSTENDGDVCYKIIENRVKTFKDLKEFSSETCLFHISNVQKITFDDDKNIKYDTIIGEFR